MTAPDPARLHEVRRDWASGRLLGPVFRSASPSIGARTSSDGVRLHRLFGPLSDDLTLPWAELGVLARAFARWASVRDGWASCTERGLPPTPVALRLYQPPGKDHVRRASRAPNRSARGGMFGGVRCDPLRVHRDLGVGRTR